MTILTYKYRLKDKHGTARLREHSAAVNQVWNYCNALQKKIERDYRSGAPKRKWLTRFDLCNMTSGVSKELGLNAKTVQSICDYYVRSRDKAKRSLRYRRDAGSKRSLGWIPFPAQGCQAKGNAITYLGKTYRFFGEKCRPLPATTTKGGAFVEDARGKWWVLFHIEVADLPNTTSTTSVGIDLGLKTLATLSDGSKVEAKQHYRKYEAKLATAQRAGNKKRVSAIHAKIANCRRDQLHKASIEIVRRYCLIVVGNVSSSKLAKTRMAKSVLDAGWAAFINMLRYKASRHGVMLMIVDESFTTQTCSSCGDCASEGRPRGIAGLGIRQWECSSCGAIHDRDVNAAKNILLVGLSAQPRVDESQRIVQ